MRRSQAKAQAERIRAQFDESIQIERERLADAQRTLKRRLDALQTG
jgi:hypothetical protein